MRHKMSVTRSSRCFFVVCLHLVGVAQWQSQPHMVLPFRIGLEEIALDRVDPKDPVWLQDSASEDNLCLGPTGRFVECGDATLWHVSRIRRRRLRMGLFGIDDASLEGWRFQVVEDDERSSSSATADSRSRWQRLRARRRERRDCLFNRNGNFSVEKCSRLFSLVSSSWEMKEDGSLQSLDVKNVPLCIMRRNHTASLSSCSDRKQQRVRFVIVNYRAITLSSTASSSSFESSTTSTSSSSTSNLRLHPPPLLSPLASSSLYEAYHSYTSKDELLVSRHQHMPATVDMAHAQAQAHPVDTTSPASAPSPAHRLYQPLSSPTTTTSVPTKNSPSSSEHLTLKALHETNPILFMGAHAQTSSRLVSKISASSYSSRSSSSPASSAPTLQGLPRRMEVHPYIAASKNEVWVDPQTGLEYYTDLCRYLGLDRTQHGRMTLMGVGQYRKGYVIKVYGVALYVSKRDALSDPALVPYAGLSAEELRARPDFYQLLRNMNPASVDRTLLLKTNMQLSAEVMRNSLHADWHYLTDEAKTTLINASMRPREAGPEMLRIIQRPDNPSRCSCTQTAPEEFQADPTCCARGTELAFTWLKTNQLEVRLNGHLMDSFPRSDIAEGIFYEYLRYDDPISPELRERVVDGFPFLLAPLASVRGVSIGQQQPRSGKAQSGGNPAVRALSSLMESVSSNMAALKSSAQHGLADAMDNFGSAARSFGDGTSNLGKDLVRHRDFLVQQMAAFPAFAMSMISSTTAQEEDDALTVAGGSETTDAFGSMDQEFPIRRDSLGRAFGYPLSRWFSETYQAPDEIGPMIIHPTMNTTRKVFLALVHLYLLLLFIVSFPGSYTTRTMLVKRKSKVGKVVNKEVECSESSSVTSSDLVDDRSDTGTLSLDSHGTPRAALAEISRRYPTARRHHHRISSSKQRRSSILRRALGPSTVTDDIQDELSCGSGNNIRLKKKSLSYFL